MRLLRFLLLLLLLSSLLQFLVQGKKQAFSTGKDLLTLALSQIQT